MKEIEALTKYLGPMLPFDSESLSGMHAPETSLERASNLIDPSGEIPSLSCIRKLFT